MSMSKEDYFNQGRSDHIAGGKALALKSGSWQFRAYWDGWDSYKPTVDTVVTPPTPRAERDHNARRMKSLKGRMNALVRKVQRHKNGGLWNRHVYPL